MRPQGAVVAAAADVVARNQKTDSNKKRRSFLRLFIIITDGFTTIRFVQLPILWRPTNQARVAAVVTAYIWITRP